jgi:uncharacterized membrane protein
MASGPRPVLRRAPILLLVLMIAVYVALFGTLTWRQHANYGTFGFDMGIHDQGIWLTSRFEDPFVTVRGMNYYGHHVNLISILYVPFYWLGGGPELLSITQAMALALGAVPLWLLTRRRTGSGWIALVPAAAWLLHPSVEWIAWWHWHPEAMAITPLLFAWWFAVERRWVWFTAMVVLALSAKEDVALAVAAMGVVLLMPRVVRARRPGVLVALGGVAWFALCTRVVIPAILGATPFYERTLFPEFGDSIGSVAWGIVSNPGKVLSTVFEGSRIEYYTQLLAPFGFLSLLGLPVLLIAGPQVLVNVLSSLPGTYDIRFQYSSMVIVGVALAGVEALGRMARHRTLLLAATALMAVGAVAANVAWSPSPMGRSYDTGVWSPRVPKHDAFDTAIEHVPADAGVSATYFLVPHLTHRREVYEWPNPWVLGNWGQSGETRPDPDTIDYIVIDRALDQEGVLFEQLTGPDGDYEIVFDESSVVVAKRRGAK